MSFPRYPQYKDSGVEWLGEVPEGWDVGPLKRFAKLQTGMTPPTDDFGNYTDEDSFQWIRPEDLDETGKPTKASKFLTTQGWRLTRQIPAGATLICCIGTIGKSGITEDIVSTNQQITAAIPIENCRYLFYSITSARTKLELASTGNVLRILNTERLGNICFPSPPRHEQQAIATFLERETAKIDALVAEQENLIALLKEKRQAVISHAVTKGLDPRVPMKDSGIEWLGEVPEGWEVKRLKNLSPFITVGIVVNPSNYVADTGLPFIYGGDIREGSIDWENARKISQESSELNSKTKLRSGDLLTVRVGAPGVTSVVPDECEGGNCASVMLVRQGPFNSHWLCFLMNTKVVRYQVEVVQYGAAQEQFNISHAINFFVPVPPRNEQECITTFLNHETAKLDDLTTEAQHTIDLLKERRSALISAAVTGKIDVRGYHVHSQPIT